MIRRAALAAVGITARLALGRDAAENIVINEVLPEMKRRR
jgi:hypothetical protein